jgi:DNA-binding SARP family transcriptional activator/tetratricopeptide (TPR) repeat protein
MEFGLLGPLVVRSAGSVLQVPQGNQRVLLAALLLDANRVVPVDEIAETLWGAAPPTSAPVTVRNYVRRLRRSLGGAGPELIAAHQHGYLIKIADDELDVRRFENLLAASLAAARLGSWDKAAAMARDALWLWRGEPLADIRCYTLAQRERPRLAELRLQALETRVEADLRLGRHTQILAELQQLACDHPHREHLQELLTLARDLPSEPSTGQASTGQPGTATAASGSGVRAAGNVAREATAAVPRLLPAPAARLTGRDSELADLDRILSEAGGDSPGTVTIAAISGTAGVGKTALAVCWAHRVADRFPDGQLYVNLRGFGPSGSPAAPAEVIRGFLEALGIAPQRVPRGPVAQGELYRSVLAGRRMLIVLDNARDEEQVRPLLPAIPGSLVLVTSRSEMAGLTVANGARPLRLDVLSAAEATQMLTRRVGAARAAAEPDAVLEIAALCSYLPLALAVAAARATVRPRFPLAELAAELRDSRGRLDALDAGDAAASVRAVFSWSCRLLSPSARRMFELLGLHPGPDISAPAAASLVGTSEPEARRLLAELTRAHLVTEHLPGRYAFHDLLRAYATSQAQAAGNQADLDAAVGRVLDHYLHTAASATSLLNQAQEPVTLARPRPGVVPEQATDYGQALAWFEQEHQVLLAAITLATQSGLDTHAWQLPWTMALFLQIRGYIQEWAATARIALSAATRLADPAAQALSGRCLAMACDDLGDHDQALGHYASSLALYQRLGNHFGEAKVQSSLGILAEHQGRYTDALGHAEQALRLYQAAGSKAGEAIALNSAGWCHGRLGDYQRGRTFSREALNLSTELGYHWLEGLAWDSLGYAEFHLGDAAEAVACYQRALSLHRQSGDRDSEASTLAHLGDTRHAVGELAQAQEAWRQALAILDDLGHPDAGQIRAKLAGASPALTAQEGADRSGDRAG